MNENNKEALETLLDLYGVEKVLETLTEICYEKSNHCSENWQDNVLARWWLRIGRMITNFSQKIRQHA